MVIEQCREECEQGTVGKIYKLLRELGKRGVKARGDIRISQ